MRCKHLDWKGRQCKRAADGHSLHVYRQLRWKGDTEEWRRTRKSVLKRGNGLCEARIEDVCRIEPRQVHHVLRRSQGGSDDPTNLLAVCAECHAWIHANPGQSYARGLLLRGSGVAS